MSIYQKRNRKRDGAVNFVILKIMEEKLELLLSKTGLPRQFCPKCGEVIGAMPGGRDATCKICGYKDPCCE